MSRGSCILTKKSLKEAIDIIENGACGKGRSMDLALEYLQNAFMRVDFHMRENGWINPTVPIPPQSQSVVLPPGSIMPNFAPQPKTQNNNKRPGTLVPAAQIPQLNRGIMNAIPVTPPAPVGQNRDVNDVMEDISLL